jgi:site-specific recombinase XerD
MTLAEAIAKYIDHKRSLGMGFITEGFILRAFCRTLGDMPITQVRSKPVAAFLDGSDPDRITANWTKKFSVVAGFYRFAIARDLTKTSPLPIRLPKLTEPAFVPYIYSQQELTRMRDAVSPACRSRKVAVAPDTYLVLLLLLYGGGLRLGEALRLNVTDVELDHALLCIRETKFHKTRLVPIGQDLRAALVRYVDARAIDFTSSPDTPFLRLRDGERVSQSVARTCFRRIRILAGLFRPGRSRYQPRLHDLRHTGAVHRLIAWYRAGQDLHLLLPRLSTYLGHVSLASTQHYLTLTPELLHEASTRFERYAMTPNLKDQS